MTGLWVGNYSRSREQCRSSSSREHFFCSPLSPCLITNSLWCFEARKTRIFPPDFETPRCHGHCPTVCTLERREYLRFSARDEGVRDCWVTRHGSNFKSFFWPGIRRFDGGTRVLCFSVQLCHTGDVVDCCPLSLVPNPVLGRAPKKPEKGAYSHRISSYDITTLQSLPHVVRKLEAHKYSYRFRCPFDGVCDCLGRHRCTLL